MDEARAAKIASARKLLKNFQQQKTAESTLDGVGVTQNKSVTHPGDSSVTHQSSDSSVTHQASDSSVNHQPNESSVILPPGDSSMTHPLIDSSVTHQPSDSPVTHQMSDAGASAVSAAATAHDLYHGGEALSGAASGDSLTSSFTMASTGGASGQSSTDARGGGSSASSSASSSRQSDWEYVGVAATVSPSVGDATKQPAAMSAEAHVDEGVNVPPCPTPTASCTVDELIQLSDKLSRMTAESEHSCVDSGDQWQMASAELRRQLASVTEQNQQLSTQLAQCQRQIQVERDESRQREASVGQQLATERQRLPQLQLLYAEADNERNSCREQCAELRRRLQQSEQLVASLTGERNSLLTQQQQQSDRHNVEVHGRAEVDNELARVLAENGRLQLLVQQMQQQQCPSSEAAAAAVDVAQLARQFDETRQALSAAVQRSQLIERQAGETERQLSVERDRATQLADRVEQLDRLSADSQAQLAESRRQLQETTAQLETAMCCIRQNVDEDDERRANEEKDTKDCDDQHTADEQGGIASPSRHKSSLALENAVREREELRARLRQCVAAGGGVDPASHAQLRRELVRLETRFRGVNEQLADSQRRLAESERLCCQLRLETDTIGEYVCLYQSQRAALHEQTLHNQREMAELLDDRQRLRRQLRQLKQLLADGRQLSTVKPVISDSDQDDDDGDGTPDELIECGEEVVSSASDDMPALHVCPQCSGNRVLEL